MGKVTAVVAVMQVYGNAKGSSINANAENTSSFGSEGVQILREFRTMNVWRGGHIWRGRHVWRGGRESFEGGRQTCGGGARNV